MNVMLTCAGRRGYAIEAFRNALNGAGRVFACDVSADAPALRAADRGFIVPQIEDPGYVDALAELCEKHRVRLLVPALEPELPLLAAQRERFVKIDTIALVSSPEVVATCYDKIATAGFLASCGLPTPRTFFSLEEARDALAVGALHFPLVIKPRWGVSSIGIGFADREEDLARAYRDAQREIVRSFLPKGSGSEPEKSILIQERCLGAEYGLDVVNDLKGRYVCTFARRKLRTRAGQTDRATTVRDARLDKVGRVIGENLRHCGPLDCDVFLDERVCNVIDLNPRIGGGYPFSHLAGANLPAALIAWARRETADPSCFEVEPNVTVSRSDSYVVVNGGAKVEDAAHGVQPANQLVPRPGKRAFDFAAAATALVLLAPVFAVVAVVVACGLGSPVLFRQRRPGLRGEPFTVMKFRTMNDERDDAGALKPDQERTPWLGRALRKTSLDELPQLWNVLRGDMSLVGPRPLLMEYLPHYTPEQQRRHLVRPGITGWAQINGRNALTFSERLKLDVWYVDHWSLALDLRILARTVVRVVRSSGVRLEQSLAEVDDIGLHPETRRKAARAAEPGGAA